MASRINDTLLNKLFINPEVLNRKRHIYNVLRQRMFPYEKSFREFLTTSDASEQKTQAKQIIQRLCFDANYPPPYSLLLNLAEFETDTKNRSSNSSYIPQDHFCHKVYMYLLGIYVFFYNPSINRALTTEFIGKRKESNFDRAMDATKDFISFWKYFCLFHDLAYPIEQLYPTDKSPVESSYLTSFNQLFNCLSREILCECAARFLILWQLINDTENNLPLEQISSSSLDDGTLNWITNEGKNVNGSYILNTYGQYKAVDKVHCFEHLKMLTGFLKTDECMIVLFDAMTEQAVAIKVVSSDKATYFYLDSKHVSISKEDATYYLDSEDALPVHTFYIKYFFDLKEEKVRLLYLENGAGDFFNEDGYRTILEKINNNPVARPDQIVHFDRITRSEELSAYIFQTYQVILDYINNKIPTTEKFPQRPTPLKTRINREKINELFKNSFIDYFKHAIIAQLPFSDFKAAEASLDGLSKIKDNFNEKEVIDIIGTAVDYLIKEKYIKQFKDEIKKEFSDQLLNAINSEKISNGMLVEFLAQCNKIIFDKVNVTQQNICLPDGVNIHTILEMCTETDFGKNHLNQLEEYIKNRMDKFFAIHNIGIEEFISKYHTDYSLYDHGIYGALIFHLCLQYYSMIISRLFETSDSEVVDIMSTLCWSVDRDKYQYKLREDYSYIIELVLRSIFCHNLYPSALRKIYNCKKSEWTYRFSKEPANYFGMMIDSLQVWNREKYYGLSNVNWWPLFSSDAYDIDIKNNKIVLQVTTFDNNLEQIKRKFISDVETYLKDFSSFVTIDIIHAK